MADTTMARLEKLGQHRLGPAHLVGDDEDATVILWPAIEKDVGNQRQLIRHVDDRWYIVATTTPSTCRCTNA